MPTHFTNYGSLDAYYGTGFTLFLIDRNVMLGSIRRLYYSQHIESIAVWLTQLNLHPTSYMYQGLDRHSFHF